MCEEQRIEWADPEGKARLIVERHSTGLFQYREDRFVREEAYDGALQEYWEPRYISGLYPSLHAARDEAAERLPWLRDLLEKSLSRD
jgi:hypothetical protein